MVLLLKLGTLALQILQLLQKSALAFRVEELRVRLRRTFAEAVVFVFESSHSPVQARRLFFVQCELLLRALLGVLVSSDYEQHMKGYQLFAADV